MVIVVSTGVLSSQQWLYRRWPFSIMRNKESHPARILPLHPGTQQMTSTASPPPSSICRLLVRQPHLNTSSVSVHVAIKKQKTKTLITELSSSTGWYWGPISASKAREALLTKSEGTFLVRDSSHPQYMLALSVKTRCGPTSVRIEYSKGCFWLDSVSPGLPQLQSFPDVLSLIQHYTSSGHAAQDQTSSDIHPQMEPDPSQHAAKDRGVPLKLKHPLHKLEVFPSLQHLTRLTINRHTNCPNQLPLPKPLLFYLQDYPFSI